MMPHIGGCLSLAVDAPADLTSRELRRLEAQQPELQSNALEDHRVALAVALELGVACRDELVDVEGQGVEHLVDDATCLFAAEPQDRLKSMPGIRCHDRHEPTLSRDGRAAKLFARNRANRHLSS